MYRHPALRPLSREHFSALLLIRDVEEACAEGNLPAAELATAVLMTSWHASLADHFAAEDRWLVPHITGEARIRLDLEHEQLRGVVAAITAAARPPVVTIYEFALKLREHIRWEERELFPLAEKTVAEAEMAVIGVALAEREDRQKTK